MDLAKNICANTQVILVVLLLWNSFFLYHAWTAAATRPAFLSFMIRFCCLIGFSTLILFYASGLYHDTLVEPRKFIPRANRALRHFNVKLVPTKRGWLRFFKANKPGQGLRLIVSSKAGSIHFREAFEEYRNTYWQQVEVNQGTKQHDK